MKRYSFVTQIPLRRVPATVGLVLLLAACSDSAQPGKLTATLPLTECRVTGVDTAVKCATLDVFENRDSRAGRKIGLNIVVLPALARVKHPDPIFVFAGGPGQAATDLAPQVSAILGNLNTKRDIVLIDQRGTGKSNLLTCKMPDPTTPGPSDPAKRASLSRKLVSECREQLAKKADLTQYSTTIAMADYDEVRQALGYAQINLWGGSYGTRTAQEYLRRYPSSVRSVVIDAVASPSLILPLNFSRDAGAVWEAMVAACTKEAACTKNFPALKRDFDAMLVSLEKSRRVSIVDPKTGVASEVDINSDAILGAVFSSLYVPSVTAVLPEALRQAASGKFESLMALTSGMGAMLEDKIAFGMRLSVSCTEDVPRITDVAAAEAAKIGPFGELFVREFKLACEDWPKSTLPKDFFNPVVSDKPVLIMSGGLDPVTPRSFGDEVKKSLTNAAHFVAPNLGHMASPYGCGPKLIKQFIDSASVSGLDGSCLARLPRPMFYQPMQERKPDAGTDSQRAGEQK